MNKRGNQDLVVFISIVVGILILGPVLLKIVLSILPVMADQLTTITPEAGANVDYINNIKH